MAYKYTTFENMIALIDSLYWDWQRNDCPNTGRIGVSKTINYTHLLKNSEDICYDEPYISLTPSEIYFTICYEQKEGFFSSKSVVEKQKLEDFCKAEGLSYKISELGHGFLSFSAEPKTDLVKIHGTRDAFFKSVFHQTYLKKKAEIDALIKKDQEEWHTYLKSLIPMVKKIYSLPFVKELPLYISSKEPGVVGWIYAGKLVYYYPKDHYPRKIERNYSYWGFNDLKSKEEIYALGLALMCQEAKIDPDSLEVDRIRADNFKYYKLYSSSTAPDDDKYGFGLRIPYYNSKIEVPPKPPLQNLF